MAFVARLDCFLFDQPNASQRITLVRISLCCVCFLLMLWGPYDAVYGYASDALFQARFPFPFFPNLGSGFLALKAVAMASAVLAAVKPSLRWTWWLFAASYVLLNFYTYCCQPTVSIENQHLNLFVLFLCFANWGRDAVQKHSVNSFLLALMMTHVVMLYLQAGFSKLCFSGWEWFASGETIYVRTVLEEGTYFGRWLTQWPEVFVAFGIGTALFQFGTFFLFLFRPNTVLVPLGAFGFHMGTYLVMGISFWFLWTLFPALYWTGSQRQLNHLLLKS